MEDTISRRAATQTALEFIVEYLSGAFDEDFQKKLMERMNTLPSAEPEVIHCCECKYWKPGYITDDDDFVPPSCAVGWVPGFWHATDYCSYAERREE